MVRKTIQKGPKKSWLVRCSQGHEFFANYLSEIVDEAIGDYVCHKCLANGKIVFVNLISLQCADGKHLLCPEDDLLECCCRCHEDPEYMLDFISELERNVEF